MVAPNKIDSNVTGLAIAVETTPGVLPATPIWEELEINSYSDFGGQIQTVARDIIQASRQNKKGTVTDLDASGGFTVDVTQNNLAKMYQGFLFADAHEKADTLSYNSAAIPITAVDGANDQFEAASGLGIFRIGDLVLASGFGVAANNGLHYLDTVAAGAVDTTSNLTAEASPPATAGIQAVGFQFGSGDCTLSVAAGVLTLGTTTKDLTQLGLAVGEWVFIGGDATAMHFATSPSGYARVATIAANAITFDKVTATFVTDAGVGKTIQIFFGKFIRNESESADIITRTYNIERTLGNDGDGVQSEYLEGAIANTLQINLPTADKMTADLGFIAQDNTQRSGATGVKSGTRVAAATEDAFNTSSKVYRSKLNILAAGTLEPTALFAYITSANISINNNASLAKAVGVLGGFDVILGNFVVGGSAEAYFNSIAGQQAVRDNADVTYDLIMAQDNAGLVYDIPLMALGNGRANVTKDQAIKIPLDFQAAEGYTGYTLGITLFPYLPNAAMPA
jgi:hypothetical protein